MRATARDGDLDDSYPRLRSFAQALVQERQKPQDTAPTVTDEEITPAHLLDDCVHNLTHALRHAKRLDDDDIETNPAAEWHNAHTVHHLVKGLDNAQRAIKALSESPSDPTVFSAETEQLKETKENVDTESDDDSDN